MSLPLKKILGANIKLMRNQKGLPKEALSKVLGIPLTKFHRIEEGEMEPSLDELARIAWALDTEASRLLSTENMSNLCDGNDADILSTEPDLEQEEYKLWIIGRNMAHREFSAGITKFTMIEDEEFKEGNLIFREHVGQELVFTLQGTIKLWFGIRYKKQCIPDQKMPPQELKKSEARQFVASIPHAYSALPGEEATALVVCWPSLFTLYKKWHPRETASISPQKGEISSDDER